MFLMAQFLMATTLAVNTNDTTTAYTSVNPVRVQACSVDPPVADYEYGDDNRAFYSLETTGEKLNIKFSNNTIKQISSVTFAVSDGPKYVRNVVDAGKFSPGITIDHYFESHAPSSSHLACSVSSVAFSDGSTWMAHSENAATR